MKSEEKKGNKAIVSAAFGAKNRTRLLDIYFASRPPVTPNTAWQEVYRLLLWADQSNGLAHCYESDKSQPGKTWYGRSLAFHDWVSKALGAAPGGLAGEIDWLFRRATSDLATEVLRKAASQSESAAKQRKPYEGKGFPQPGEDPELVSIVKEVLGPHLGSAPSPAEWQRLVQRIRQYLALENKRRNLVGEGFEDVLAAVIRRVPGGNALDVRTRQGLHQLPGFSRSREGDKPNKVDLAVIREQQTTRTLITAKWSVRADREKQFTSEFTDYVNAETMRKPFEYVFITNEFDPARLMRACEALVGNALMFTYVVHMNPAGLKAAYGAASEKSMQAVLGHISSGRLISLESWLMTLIR